MSKIAALPLAQSASLSTTIEQLDGVLICALAAAAGVPDMPAAIRGALWAAARLSGEARVAVCGT